MKDAEGMVSADTSVRVALDLAEAEVRRERARCLAWVEAVWRDLDLTEGVAIADFIEAGIESGEWPSEVTHG